MKYKREDIVRAAKEMAEEVNGPVSRRDFIRHTGISEHHINREFPEDPSYLQNQSVFYNYDLHSDFSALSLEELKLKVEGSINQTHEFLKTTDWLFFTFGTAIGYYLKTSNNLVANCHKVPSREFEKKLISKREI